MTDREFMKHGLTSSFYSMVGNLTFSRGGATKDEKNDCNVGDKVRIMETRPLSKNKCWRLVEIIERAK